MQRTFSFFIVALAFSSLAMGCVDPESLCFKHCEKGHDCEEGEPGHIDLSNCKENCRDLAERTQEHCTMEMVRWSECMKKRYDCERGREDACDRKRDDLRSCLNANE